MTIREKIDALIADAHQHGYGSEIPKSVTDLLHTVGDELDALRVDVAKLVTPVAATSPAVVAASAAPFAPAPVAAATVPAPAPAAAPAAPAAAPAAPPTV